MKVQTKFCSVAKARQSRLEENRRRSLDALCRLHHTTNIEEACRRAHHESFRNFDFHAYMQSQATKNGQLNNMKPDTTIKARVRSNMDFMKLEAFMQSEAKNGQLSNMKLKAKAEDTINKAQEEEEEDQRKEEGGNVSKV